MLRLPGCSLLWSFFLAFSIQTLAQPVADIRPLLKALSKEDKNELKKYLYHLGAQPDDEIQNIYRALPESSKKKVLELVDFYRQPNWRDLLTTVVWTPDTLDFGQLEEGERAINAFTVTNTGKYPYLIDRQNATCDCTVVSAPAVPIMSGEAATLRVEFNAKQKVGQSRPVIIVYDNSTPNRRNILHVKAHVSLRQKSKFPWEQ